MSFRNRPVLDRKHRPRWQDELRSQQLIVAGFALAIAVAIGLFGAVAWNGFYNANLRQVALVNGQSIDRADLNRRADLIAAQLTATYLDLGTQLGGARDQIIQSQLQSLQQAINSVQEIASDSIVSGIVLAERADELGLSVSDAEVDAEVEERRHLPARTQLSIILVEPPLDEGAEPGSEPTEENWAAAKATIDDLKAQLDDGADFAALATEHSDGPAAATGGLIGWVTAEDPTFGEYLEEAGDAEAGTVVGPTRNEQGWYLIRVNERQERQRDENLDRFLAAAGISDAAFRDFVRQDLLQAEFRDYFTNVVIGRYAPQRHVAQILIRAEQDGAAPAPKIQVRHLLAQPLPGEQDQSAATDAQWEAALERAEELRAAAMEPDADWYELADESDDRGSRTRGGSLGWVDPGTLDTQFVTEFADAVAALDIGEISEPVRSEFGYHVIQVTDRRVNAGELAQRLATDLQEDPERFEQLARDYSEDTVTARQGGDLGWVIPYQFEPMRQDAIFAMTEIGAISEPLVTEEGTYIFKLLDTSPSRFVPEARREQVTGSGFSRWLVELEEQAGVWVDPDIAPPSSIGTGTGTGTTPLTP